jgi:hypothetical protein
MFNYQNSYAHIKLQYNIIFVFKHQLHSFNPMYDCSTIKLECDVYVLNEHTNNRFVGHIAMRRGLRYLQEAQKSSCLTHVSCIYNEVSGKIVKIIKKLQKLFCTSSILQCLILTTQLQPQSV